MRIRSSIVARVIRIDLDYYERREFLLIIYDGVKQKEGAPFPPSRAPFPDVLHLTTRKILTLRVLIKILQ